MISALGIQVGVTLTPSRIVMADGTHVEVDGVSDDPPVLVEAWVHQGPPKPAQRNKVLADAMKLVLVGSALGSYDPPDAAVGKRSMGLHQTCHRIQCTGEG